MSNSQQMPTVISEKEHLNALIWKQPYCKPNTCLEVCPLNMTWIKKWITRVTYSMKISHGTVSLHLWRLGWWPQPTSWSSSIDSQGLVGFKATNWIFTSKTRKNLGQFALEIPVVRTNIFLEWDSVDQISSSQKQVTWCYMILIQIWIFQIVNLC